MHVEDLRELGGHRLQAPFQFGIVQQLVSGLDGCGLALDVGEDGRNLRDVLANLGFEDGHAVVSFFQAQAFVEFEVLFDVQVALEILHADVVNIEIVAGSNGANAIENVFCTQGAGNGVHDDVGIGQDIMHGVGDGFRHLLGALESYVAGDTYRKISEVTIAGAANAHAVDFKQTIDGGNRGDNLVAYAGRGGVEQGVNRLAGQAPADVDDHAGHEQRCDWVSIA